MGKGNRVKNEKAVGVLNTGPNKKAAQKKSMPTWAGTLIVVAVIVALLLVALLSALSSRGVFRRMHVVARTDNYKVSATMMSYVLYSEYQTLVDNYNSYYDYIYGGSSSNINIQISGGTGGDSLDTSVSLRKQYYSRPTEESPNTPTQTWFDHFAEQAQDDIQQILSYCEQAKARGIKLEDEDYATIDSAIDSIETYVAYYANGLSTSAYISTTYGSGVTVKDVRRVMELTQLASKYAEVRRQEIFDAAADGVDAEYLANPDEYNIYIDFIGYTFTVDFKPTGEDAEADAEAWKTYRSRQRVLADRVKALEEAETDEEFLELLRQYLYEDAIEEGLEEDEANKKADEGVEAAKVTSHEKDSSTAALDTWGYDDERQAGDKTKFETAPNGREKVGGDDEPGDDTGDDTTGTDDGNDGDATDPGDGDDADPDENENDEDEFDSDAKYTYEEVTSTYSVYRLKRTKYADNDSVVRDVGHLLFKDSTYEGLTSSASLTGLKKELADRILAKGLTISAQTMAEELIEMWKNEGKLVSENGYYTMSKDLFEELATELTEDSNVFYEKVQKGKMAEEFENWLFDSARHENEVSVPAVATKFGYHIMFFTGKEQNAFRYRVQSDITDREYKAWEEAAKDAIKVDFNQKAFKYIA